MGITSLQVCMDSSDWFQGTIHEDAGMDSSSPSGGDNMLTCSRPSLMERRLRPQHDQALKCPRCDSTHTKFCYYNNYSLSQPRYFCKTCRRYWTKGGTLRNIPVGGGCRKNKKVSSKKSSSTSSSNNESTIHDHQSHHPSSIIGYNTTPSSSSSNPTDLHLSSFPHEVQLNNLILGNPNPNNFMMMDDGIAGNKYNHNMMMLEIENPSAASVPIHDFMDNKFEALVGLSSRNVHHDDHHDMMMGMFTPNNNNNNSSNYPFGMMSVDGNSSAAASGGSCQRLMLPYYGHQDPIIVNGLHDEVKPNTKLLSLEWHDHQQQGGVGGSCSDASTGKDNNSFGYMNIGQWPGLMNVGYGSSATTNTTTNPLV